MTVGDEDCRIWSVSLAARYEAVIIAFTQGGTADRAHGLHSGNPPAPACTECTLSAAQLGHALVAERDGRQFAGLGAARAAGRPGWCGPPASVGRSGPGIPRGPHSRFAGWAVARGCHLARRRPRGRARNLAPVKVARPLRHSTLTVLRTDS